MARAISLIFSLATSCYDKNNAEKTRELSKCSESLNVDMEHVDPTQIQTELDLSGSRLVVRIPSSTDLPSKRLDGQVETRQPSKTEGDARRGFWYHLFLLVITVGLGSSAWMFTKKFRHHDGDSARVSPVKPSGAEREKASTNVVDMIRNSKRD